MPLGKSKFMVRVDAAHRILFSVLEKPNGELIIPLRTADRLDSRDGPRLLEQRYSVHPSDNSPDFTTIKQTINAEGGKSITSVVLTDAVKKRSGFSLILVRRVQNLAGTRYLTKQKKNERGYVLADLHPTLHTFFFGIFIGHPDTPFECAAADVVVSHFPFKRFKILVLSTARLIPSHYATDYAHAVTLPPDKAPDKMTRASLRYQMEGKSPEICTKQFQNTVRLLTRVLYERAITELTEPHLIQYVREEIAALGHVSMTPLGLDTGPQSIHILADGSPPNSQSPQSLGFVRRLGREEDQAS